MLDDVVQSEINLPQVGLFLGGHQPGTKVVNRGETFVIVSLRINGEKERAVVIATRLLSIFTQEASLLEADEESPIYISHIILEKTLQQIQTPTTTLIPTALTALEPSVRSSFTRRENTTPQRRPTVLREKLAIYTGNRPPHRAGSKVKTNVVVALNIAQFHLVPNLCYSKHVLITSQDDTASQNTALPKMPSGAA